MDGEGPAIAWEDVASVALDGVAVTDGDTLVRSNDVLVAMYDVDPNEGLAGTSWCDLFEPGERDRIEREALAAVEESGQWTGEAVGRRADGSTFPQRLSLSRTDDGLVVWCVRDVSERLAREREIERFEAIVETFEDGVYALDDDLRFSMVDDTLCEMVDMEADEVLGSSVSNFFVYDDEYAVAEEIRERVLAGDVSVGSAEGTVVLPDGTPIRLETRYRLYPEPDGGYRGSVGTIRDVGDRSRRERTLARQRDEMATLNHLNRLHLDIMRELVETSSRERIARTVCDRLVGSDLYQTARVGEREIDGDGIEWQVVARGDGPDAAPREDRDSSYRDELAKRAMERGTVEVASTGRDAGPGRADESFDRSGRAIAAVPFTSEGAVYGVLVVRSSRPDAFSDREREGFEVLGRAVGFASEAIQTERLLFAESTVELELSTDGTSMSVVELAGRLDCRIRLDGFVATGDGSWLAYVDVDGSPVTDVAGTAVDYEKIEGVRVVRDDGDGGSLELTLGPSSFLGVFGGVGARIQMFEATGDDARVVVHVPGSADLRSVVTRVQRTYPGVELLARRERDRSPGDDGGGTGPIDRLTDRQRQVIEVAYRAGFFDWPRSNTGEEVAETLDVSPPTLHAHLRKAERRLLAALLD